MKIFNSIANVSLILLLVGCQPDEIKINTAPLFPATFLVEGTNINTGEAVSKMMAESETGIPIDAVITVSFSKLVDAESASAVSISQEGNSVAASIIASGESIVIDPSALLEFGKKYTITLGNNIKADDGGMFLNEVTRTFTTEIEAPSYVPLYDGEIFYMSFDGAFTEFVSGTDPTIVGTPGLAGEGVLGGNSYAGADDSYLTFPAAGLQGDEFSAAFWLKVNAVPDRSGVLVMGPPDAVNPATPNNRTAGFRFFRENASGKQRFKLNVGDGTADSWFDGGAAADVDPAADQWVHFAFTISGMQAVVYIDGQVVSQGAFPGVSWTGVDVLSIMSGAPRFTEWGHLSDESFMDELRLFNKALTQQDVQTIFEAESGGPVGYTPRVGETFYMPFDGNNTDLVSNTGATVVGTPGLAGEGVLGGNSYLGAANSYLTFPAAALQGNEFSAAFWLKINAVPDRAGILVMGPPDPNLPATPNNRTSGFRFFRENASGKQRFKLNVGNGTADSWFDGGAAADVDPATNQWVHFAFTISGTEAVVYIDGLVVSQGAFTGISWAGVDVLSIMSGAPRFTEWGHLSDESYMDELHLFNKALTQIEIQAIINGN